MTDDISITAPDGTVFEINRHLFAMSYVLLEIKDLVDSKRVVWQTDIKGEFFEQVKQLGLSHGWEEPTTNEIVLAALSLKQWADL